MTKHLTRMSALAIAGAAALTLAAGPAAAAQAVVPFAADSGDQCRRGTTEGTLEWLRGPVIRPTVEVKGYLADDASLSGCAADTLYSRATLTAYKGETRVDSETFKVNNGKIELSFALSDPTGVTRIDRVVVQVCRFSDSPIGISYCGPAQEYKTP